MVDELEKESRQTRIAQYLVRQAMRGEHTCFEMFLWYFRPDGSWALVVGSENEYHADLWRKEGRSRMAHDWEIDISSIPTNFDPSWVPSGYVDFIEERGREFMVLVVPSVYPDGWDESKTKKTLLCSDKITRIKPNAALNTDPDTVKSYHRMFERIRGENHGG
jgi:hypothetical protein